MEHWEELFSVIWSVRDEILHQSIDSSPEVDVASPVGLTVVEILLALEQILHEELRLPWNTIFLFHEISLSLPTQIYFCSPRHHFWRGKDYL